MPYVNIRVAGKLSKEQKANIAKGVTDVISKEANKPISEKGCRLFCIPYAAPATDIYSECGLKTDVNISEFRVSFFVMAGDYLVQPCWFIWNTVTAPRNSVYLVARNGLLDRSPHQADTAHRR